MVFVCTKSPLHLSFIHYQVTFELESGRGSETSIALVASIWGSNVLFLAITF